MHLRVLVNRIQDALLRLLAEVDTGAIAVQYDIGTVDILVHHDVELQSHVRAVEGILLLDLEVHFAILLADVAADDHAGTARPLAPGD